MAEPATVREFADSTFLDILDDSARALAGKRRGPMVRELQKAFTDLRASLAARGPIAISKPNARLAWRALKASPGWDVFEDFLREIYDRGGLPYEAAVTAAGRHAKLIGVDLGPDDLAKLAGRWVDRRGAEFVREISKTTRDGMRELIRGAYRLDTQGNRAALGRSVRDLLLKDPPTALTRHQMKGFLNDVERKIKAGRIVTQKGIDRAWRKHVFRRARFIASNEGRINARAGQEMAFELAGVEDLNGVFTSREGRTSSGPLLHPGCLCGVRLRRWKDRLVAEWITRSSSNHAACIAFDGAIRGGGFVT